MFGIKKSSVIFGTSAIIAGWGGGIKTHCAFCGKKSQYYCDYVLGFTGPYSEDKNTRLLISIDKVKIATCDAPICKGCSTRIGHYFICGKPSIHETIDHCPVHKYAESYMRVLTIGEAEHDRLRDWKLKSVK